MIATKIVFALIFAFISGLIVSNLKDSTNSADKLYFTSLAIFVFMIAVATVGN